MGQTHDRNTSPATPAVRSLFESLEPRRLLSATVVTDIMPGIVGSHPGKVHELGGLNLFAASDDLHGRELWRTDGTAAGTRMVKDLVPGSLGGNPDYYFAALNGAGYFIADDALWRTDGTEAGTFIVQDDPDARYFQNQRYITEFNGALYFWDTHASGAARLWRSDGTADGLSRILPFGGQPTAADSRTRGRMTPFGDTLLFSYADGLWRTDGTQGGTSQIAPIRMRGDFHRLGDAMMFMSQFRGRTGIWRTDGTAAGTWVVKNLYAGEISGDADLGVVHGRTLYFAGKDDMHGTELWKTDGTADGTVMVADILPAVPDPNIGWPWGLAPAEALPAVGAANALYSGSLQLDIIRPPVPDPTSSSPSHFQSAGDTVVFTAVTKNSDGQFYRTLYRTDGTADGTVQIADFGYGSGNSGDGEQTSVFSLFENVGGSLFFTTNRGIYGTDAVYVTDGFKTRLVHYTYAGDDSRIESLSSVGGSLYFSATTDEYGQELMRWDATGGITGFAHDDANGDGVRDVSELPLVGWRVFLDRNGDGVFNRGEKFTFADENGAYGFPAYPDGDYTVRVSPPEDGWTSQTISAAVRAGRTTWRDVSAARVTPAYGSVSGNVFDDADFDGAFDTGKGDGPREGVRVYLDLNRNGFYNPGEPAARSDAAGNYRIENVPPGHYRLAAVDLGPGHEYTRGLERMLLVRPNRSHAFDFGIGYDGGDGVIHGNVFHDRDGDKRHDRGEAGFAGMVLYLDKNGDRRLNPGERSTTTDSTGFFELTGLRRGTHRLRQVAFPDGEWRLTTDPLRVFSLSVADTGTMSFGYEPAGTISGYVFDDRNGNGFPKAAAGEHGIAGYTVYSDLNNDGQWNADEPTTVSRADGFFELKHLKPGTHRPRMMMRYDRTGWAPTTPDAHLTVSVTGGKTVERSIGVAAGGTVTGSIFHDLNYDGVRQDNEAGVAGATVTLTRSHSASPSPRTVLPVTTDDDGFFRFNGVYQGQWQLAPSLGDTWQYIVANSTVTVRQSVENPFAPIAARRTPQVVGALFKDVNGNGTTDNGEVRLPGYVIYVDKDDDGRLDANEPRFTTNERGTFYIFDLALGPVRLRYVPQPGDGLAGNSIMADIQAAGNQRFTVFGARLES